MENSITNINIPNCSNKLKDGFSTFNVTMVLKMAFHLEGRKVYEIELVPTSI